MEGRYYIKLGYAVINMHLRKDHIFTNRTTRIKTLENEGLGLAIYLFIRNLQDLHTILEYNEKHNIEFYRMGSGMAPHITNPALILVKYRKDYKKLAYSLNIPEISRELQKIGQFARQSGHRLTFHPDPYISLGTLDADILIRNTRELYFHAKMLDKMALDCNSVIVIHGGGVYENKSETIQRWVDNFNKLSNKIKRRVVLENDEFSYSIDDVLKISSLVEPYEVSGFKTSKRYKIPIVFDIFHYLCYNKVSEIKNRVFNKVS